jgi:hypothetical protein
VKHAFTRPQFLFLSHKRPLEHLAFHYLFPRSSPSPSPSQPSLTPHYFNVRYPCHSSDAPSLNCLAPICRHNPADLANAVGDVIGETPQSKNGGAMCVCRRIELALTTHLPIHAHLQPSTKRTMKGGILWRHNSTARWGTYREIRRVYATPLYLKPPNTTHFTPFSPSCLQIFPILSSFLKFLNNLSPLFLSLSFSLSLSPPPPPRSRR